MKDESPDGETEYHARFYFYRGTLRMGVGEILDVFTGYDDSTSVFTVQMQKDLTSFQLRIGARNDLGTWTYSPAWTTISNDWNGIEVEYLRGTNSGEMRLWVNGVLAQTLTVLDTDTIAIDSVQLGVMGVDSGTRGTLNLDDFTSMRFSTIGMLPDPGVHENLPVVHTYTSQPDGTAGVDTFINSSGSTSNYGTVDYMLVGYSSDTNGKYRSLIKFNLASIPANATITSATLILRLNYQG